jgi:hypothetical protein
VGGKLKREYTGDWVEDERHGRGTLFSANGDRYDGFWICGNPQGDGRMIYANEDIYEGQWHEGKRNGYGVLTKKNGDHFEGHWVNDKREGQGSYYFSGAKNKLFVGEWVDDQPKCGVYTEVEDEDAPAKKTKPHFLDSYAQPDLPAVQLANPAGLLDTAMESVKAGRARYRAMYIPIDEMFTELELEDLQRAFETASQGQEVINLLSLKTCFSTMGFFPSDEALEDILLSCGLADLNEDISFDLFARTIALLIEENTRFNKGQTEEEEDDY